MKEKKCVSGECCHPQMSCNCGVGGKCLVGRWILGIVILLAVFSLGFKLGEFKSRVENGESGYGRRMMYGQSWQNSPRMGYPAYSNDYGPGAIPAPEQPVR